MKNYQKPTIDLLSFVSKIAISAFENPNSANVESYLADSDNLGAYKKN